jgi:HSP20 family molecular chaperone IbpA
MTTTGNVQQSTQQSGPSANGGGATILDETIQRIERFYASLTGKEPPAATDGALPPEKDAVAFVETAIERLAQALSGSVTTAPLQPMWLPLVDLVETERDYVVSADLPGVDRANVRVAITGSLLRITGERSTRTPASTPRCVERGAGAFARHVALAPNAQLEDATARLADGVLEIRIPKGSAAKTTERTVTIG